MSMVAAAVVPQDPAKQLTFIEDLLPYAALWRSLPVRDSQEAHT